MLKSTYKTLSKKYRLVVYMYRNKTLTDLKKLDEAFNWLSEFKNMESPVYACDFYLNTVISCKAELCVILWYPDTVKPSLLKAAKLKARIFS